MAVKMQCDVSRNKIAGDAGEVSRVLTHKWYFSRKEIELHSPSRSDGIDYKHEEHLRMMYCAFLQELGMDLKVPQLTIATAMMFCHRFYMRQSLAKNDWQTMATVCMFLACKAEETPRSLSELVVAYKLIYKWYPSASRRIHEIKKKKKKKKKKELILIGERLLLHVLAFDMNIEHPYKSLVSAVKRLDVTHKDLVKVAWNFVNDWLRISLCLQHKPHYIAAGSLFLASKIMKVKLPTSKGKTWWMEFDVSPKQLEDVIQQMTSMWEHSQSQRQTVELKKEKVTESPIIKPMSNCVKKVDTSRETTNRQTSDTGSGGSVVEDGEPVTVKSDLSSSCKVVNSVGVVDVNKIREKFKNRNLNKTLKRACVEEGVNDGEDWIEGELENGIVLQSTYPQKQRKI